MDDPMAAANLVEDLPASSMRHAIQPLVEVWSRTNPEEAARWLAKQNAQVSAEGLSHLAMRWGQSDFEAANDWADTLTGRNSDDQAIRLGRDYGFDRNAVLELRENRGRMLGPGGFRTYSSTVYLKSGDME